MTIVIIGKMYLSVELLVLYLPTFVIDSITLHWDLFILKSHIPHVSRDLKIFSQKMDINQLMKNKLLCQVTLNMVTVIILILDHKLE